ncbi:unnamed protein product [Sympodiomycopsis kandeliae]
MSSHKQQEHESAPTIDTHKFASWNPFRDEKDEGGEELGEEITDLSVAGGGRGTFGGNIEERKQLKVSHALRRFLHEKGELKESDIGKEDDEPNTPALQAILARQPTLPPSEVNDRGHPLSSYLISSSHNSYLAAGQLRGKSSADRYTQILRSGCRCVEIDAWDGKEPGTQKITHGFTATDHISFESAIEAIGRQMDEEIEISQKTNTPAPLPVFISLENHCSPEGQLGLAKTMREKLGDKLVTESVHADGTELLLQDVEGKILVMVEYYGATDEDEAKDEVKTKGSGEEADDAPKKVKIIPELSELGVYAQSIKPSNDSWLKGKLATPSFPLLNLGEGALKEIIPHSRDSVVRANSTSLMRVYPAGTRIFSSNLNPVPLWGVGAHVAALNCQTFDHAMQLQEALFDGTYGWALKPGYLRGSGARPSGTTKLDLEVVGGSDLPIPQGRDVEDIKPYITCTLYHPSNIDKKPEKKKTSHYKRHHKLNILHKHESPLPNNPIWHHPETLSWTYPADELVFLRILLKSDDSFAKNPVFAASAVRVSYLQEHQGYVFLRLFNLRGEKTRGTLCVKFTVSHQP